VWSKFALSKRVYSSNGNRFYQGTDGKPSISRQSASVLKVDFFCTDFIAEVAYSAAPIQKFSLESETGANGKADRRSSIRGCKVRS